MCQQRNETCAVPVSHLKKAVPPTLSLKLSLHLCYKTHALSLSQTYASCKELICSFEIDFCALYSYLACTDAVWYTISVRGIQHHRECLSLGAAGRVRGCALGTIRINCWWNDSSWPNVSGDGIKACFCPGNVGWIESWWCKDCHSIYNGGKQRCPRGFSKGGGDT